MSAVLVTYCNCQGNDRFLSTLQQYDYNIMKKCQHHTVVSYGTSWNCGFACPTHFLMRIPTWPTPHVSYQNHRSVATWIHTGIIIQSVELWKGFPCDYHCAWTYVKKPKLPIIAPPFLLFSSHLLGGHGNFAKVEKAMEFFATSTAFFASLESKFEQETTLLKLPVSEKWRQSHINRIS